MSTRRVAPDDPMPDSYPIALILCEPARSEQEGPNESKGHRTDALVGAGAGAKAGDA